MWLNEIRKLLTIKLSRSSRRNPLPRQRGCRIGLECLEDRVTPSNLLTLASFDYSNGAYPQSGLAIDSSGDLFGTTYEGGPDGEGSVFEMMPGSGGYTLNTIASFNGADGADPQTGLAINSSGDIFGTTQAGGSGSDGTVFELTPGSGGYTLYTIASFNGTNGADPQTGLAINSSGDLFGTTYSGGTNSEGTVFEVTPGSQGYTLNTIVSFAGATNGEYPEAGLLLNSSGDLFGTTSSGGTDNEGTVFELTPGSGSYTLKTLVNFSGSNGANPEAGLVMNSSGDLYGTTYQGGYDYGTVFELTPGSGGSYTLSTLINFNNASAGATYPEAGVVLDSQGDVYGTTYSGGANGDGTVFEVSPGSPFDTLNTLASFDGTDGNHPEAGLVMDGNGDFFGTTYEGGANSEGTVFELPATPVVSGISPSTGAEGGGTTVAITGTGLDYATGVEFGADAGTIVSDSPTQLVATSSEGSALGVVDVTVSTPGGASAKSSADEFTYIAAPTVAAVSPSAGPLSSGDTVTITGTNLTGATAVNFGTTAATSFTVNSATQITAVDPAAQAGTVNVTVTAPLGTSTTSSADQFTYVAAPTVTSVSPADGLTTGGATVTITGTNLSNATTVEFGTTQGTIDYDFATQIIATSPAEGAGSANVAVAAVGGTSATSLADKFLFVAPADSATSKITLSDSSVAAGSTIEVTLQAKDASGNDLTTGGQTVAFALGSGSGLGTLSSATDNGNGTYTATFKGTLAGSIAITATLNGQAVTSGSPSVSITTGPVSLAMSTVEVLSSSVASGSTDTVTLYAEDAYGNDLTAGGLSIVFSLVSAGGGQGTFSSVTDNGDGTYSATFTGTATGTNDITASITGQALTSSPAAVTVTANLLASFDYSNGAYPQAGLLMNSSGDLFGTTYEGGPDGEGSVFEMMPGSGGYTLNTIASFNGADGLYPAGGVVINSSGDIFGTTQAGGSGSDGTVFELTPGSGGYTLYTIASFNGTNGDDPQTGLLMNSSGDLFGTTYEGGANSEGTVFEVTPGSQGYTLNTIVSFAGATNGEYPEAGLLLNSSGDLFGTTNKGGTDNEGTVFELTPGSGSYTLKTLVNFSGSNGANPEAGLVMNSSGDLYGTTNQGGYDYGTVFELTPGSGGSYTLSTLINFSGTNGEDPEAGVVLDNQGDVYGTTYSGGANGDGTVFEVSPGSPFDTLNTLASFNGADGENPEAGLAMDSNGDFFGTTYEGGAIGYGTVFELPATPVVSGISPSTGAEGGGTTVTITGTGLDYATGVEFGADAGTIVSDSPTQLVATSSEGSALGVVDVTVSTPGGASATSSADEFTYLAAPTVAAVSPSAGPLSSGDTVTITGTNLTDATAVDFGSSPGTIVPGTDTATQIVVDDPTGQAGTVNVTVTTPSGTSTTSSADQFTYVAAPTVISISPANGLIGGGTMTTITGTGLADATTVDFGTTPGTIVSDSATQIVATIPAEGAGTVDVTVTTVGGTSATGSTDKFLFAVPADPATSTITLSEASVASGSDIMVTLQAEDAEGDDLGTGGQTVTFALGSASGGQGTFSTVTDNGNGTYTAMFAGTIAGSNTITATLNEQAVTSGSPSVSITTGPVSLAMSTVEVASPSVAAGSTDTITLQAEDAYGNDLATGGATVKFALGSTSGGQGTFGLVTDNGNGTYTTSFAGTIAGSNTITATINGQAVTTTAPAVTVTPGPVSVAMSMLTISSPSVAAESTDTVTLQAEDAYGNDLTTGGLSVVYSLVGGVGQGTFSSAAYDGNGVYTAAFTGTIAGDNNITATIGGQAVTTTAPAVTVTPGPVSVAMSMLTISSPSVAAGSTDTITLQAEDAYGNDLATGGATVKFALGSTSGGQGTFGLVTDNGNGTYTTSFAGTIAGSNTITATINGQAVTTTAPAVTVTPGPVSVAMSMLTISSPSVAAESTDTVTLQAEDAYGNDLTTGGLSVVYSLVGGVGQGTFSSAAYDGNGVYTAAFTGTIAGDNNITATIGGQKLATTAPAVTVTPGPVDLGMSTIASSSSSVTAGNTITVTLRAEDSYGNAVSAAGTVVFSLVGGSAQGTFGTVTNDGNGTYTALFTGKIAGTAAITATINGQAVTSGSPSVSVTPGPVSLAYSMVEASLSSVAAGSTDTITLQAEDAYGNDLTAGGLPFVFSLTGGGQQGTFGPVTDNGNGTYTVAFTGGMAGTTTISATLNDQPLTSKGAAVTVEPGPVDAAKCSVTLSSDTLASGSSTTVTLQAEDAYENDLISGGATVKFALGSASGSQGAFSTVTDVGNGTYTVTFTGTIEGSNTITATIDGQPVTSLAPSISVTPGAVDPANSIVTLTPSTIQFGGVATITLQARDAAGNDDPTGVSTPLFTLGSTGTAAGTWTSVTNDGNGLYTTQFTGTSDGTDSILAAMNSEAVGTGLPPVITVTLDAVSTSKSKLSVASKSIEAGGTTIVTLQAEDAKGKLETGGGLSVVFASSGQGTLTPATYGGNGTYTAIFAGTIAGSNAITATIDGAKVTSTAATVAVTAGQYSLATSTVSVSATSAKAGSKVTATLQPKDAYGNKLTAANEKGLLVAFVLNGTTVQGKSNANGTYTAALTVPTTAGTYTITATIDGRGVASTTAITVTAGATSPDRVLSEASETSVAVGGAIDVALRAADGNDSTTGS